MINILKLASAVQGEVDKLIAETFDDPHYMYYHINGYVDYKTENNSNWYKEEYVSVDSQGNVNGHFHARIDRNTRGVASISAINFDKNSNGVIFAMDFKKFIDKLFLERNYYRISFCVITKNPIMKMYDKFIRNYKGKVVGTFTFSERLSDGRLYDCKHYEMFRKDYILASKRRDENKNDSNSTSTLDEGLRELEPVTSI